MSSRQSHINQKYLSLLTIIENLELFFYYKPNKCIKNFKMSEIFRQWKFTNEIGKTKKTVKVHWQIKWINLFKLGSVSYFTFLFLCVLLPDVEKKWNIWWKSMGGLQNMQQQHRIPKIKKHIFRLFYDKGMGLWFYQCSMFSFCCCSNALFYVSWREHKRLCTLILKGYTWKVKEHTNLCILSRE